MKALEIGKFSINNYRRLISKRNNDLPDISYFLFAPPLQP